MCPVWRTLPVLRDGKYAASYEVRSLRNICLCLKENNAQDITDDLYPDFCTGWLWITNPGTAGQIAKASPVVKHFWIDDVWITGYIAKHLEIEHQVLRVWLREALKKTKKMLTNVKIALKPPPQV